MSLNKFVHTFEAAIETIEPGTLSAQTNYKELKAWDSLAILTVTDAIEMEYVFLLSRKHFESAQTVKDLYEGIRQND